MSDKNNRKGTCIFSRALPYDPGAWGQRPHSI